MECEGFAYPGFNQRSAQLNRLGFVERIHFFDTRQYDYAVLGLVTDAIMFELRKHAGIPFEEIKEGEWSRQQIMNDTIKAIDEKRQQEHSRWKAGSFPPPYVAAPQPN